MRTSDPSLEATADDRIRTETVSEPRRLVALLKGLKANRTLLSARVDDHAAWYNTALLKLDADTGDIYLDELSPREGHDRLQAGSALHLTGVLNGVPTDFSTRILGVGEQRGIAFYRATLPGSMNYQQRRATFRAYVGRGMRLTVRLVSEEARVVSGRLLDLSLGGFGAVLPEDAALYPLDVVTVEALELPEQEPISCIAEVRYLHEEYSEPVLRAGFRFMDLHPQAERTLLRAILLLEREQIRRQVR